MSREPETREAGLERLLAEHLDAAARGQDPGEEELLRRHPDLADDLRKRLASLKRLDGALGCLRAAAESPAPPPTPRIPGYAILERMGRGGMGVVYLAEQSSLKRLVALKTVTAGGDARSSERFRREAEAIARLSHPSIVPIHDYGESDGVYYLALALVPGADLAEILGELRASGLQPSTNAVRAIVRERERRLRSIAERSGARCPTAEEDLARWSSSYPEFCARVVLDVAEALERTHAAGMLHRDVKPSNIVVSLDGRATLVDFGLSLTAEASQLTRPTDFLGSVPYAAPEHLSSNDRAYAPAGEIFSLGAVLYELLSLRRAFDGAGIPEIVARVIDANPPDLGSTAPATPEALRAICRRSLAKDPARRHPSAKALADELRAYLSGRATPASRSPRASTLVAAFAALAAAAIWRSKPPTLSPAPAVSAPPPAASPAAPTAPAAPPPASAKPLERKADEIEAIRALLASGDSELAARRADRLLARAPDDPRALVTAAWARLKLSDAAAAERHAEAAARVDPASFEAWKALGHARQALGRPAEAADAFDRSLRLSPMDLNARVAYAETLSRAGRSRQAEKQYELCLAQAPENRSIMQAYAAALARHGEYGESVRQYQRSLGDDSRDSRAHLVLGELLIGLKRHEEADYYLKAAERLAANETEREAAREALKRLPPE